MEDELIAFETAKIAKEKGFNESTSSYYHPTYGFCDGEGKELDTYNDASWAEGYYSAPTQSLLQRWLREVHGLELYTQTSVGKAYHIYAILTTGKYGWLDGKSHPINKHFDTYEQALEAGLLEALKLIEV